MLMPTVFHENLFDDFFDPFWNDAALERMMNREARDTFGKRGANMMKTDVKQTDNGYEVAVDLPGCKKEDVQMDLNDGYLTIQAVRSHSNDEKDQKGRYVRRETFSGTCAHRRKNVTGMFQQRKKIRIQHCHSLISILIRCQKLSRMSFSRA